MVVALDGGTSIWLNKNFWQATVTVTVSDADGQPLPNASVYGNFEGVKRGEVTGVTDEQGQVVFSKNISKDQPSVTFKVTDVTHATFSSYTGETSIDLTHPSP